MSVSKKIILLIVEGPTEADSLNPILKKIFSENNIKFHIVHGDITIKNGIKSCNAVTYINKCIQQEMEKYRFKKKDIIRIIHIIDTDGAFIPDVNIEYGNVEKILYNDNSIITSNVEYIRNRNRIKKEVVERLYSTGNVNKIPYEIYYFSRNMEHVLHDNTESISDDRKEELADLFADKYKDNIDLFIRFINNSDFTVNGDFNTTWKFILDNNNSLKKYSNIHIMLKKNPREK